MVVYGILFGGVHPISHANDKNIKDCNSQTMNTNLRHHCQGGQPQLLHHQLLVCSCWRASATNAKHLNIKRVLNC